MTVRKYITLKQLVFFLSSHHKYSLIKCKYCLFSSNLDSFRTDNTPSWAHIKKLGSGGFQRCRPRKKLNGVSVVISSLMPVTGELNLNKKKIYNIYIKNILSFYVFFRGRANF